MKKNFLVAAALVATMSLASGSVSADGSPPTSVAVNSSNSGIQPRTSFEVIDNANLNNGGNSWSQPSGYDYARVYITNTTSQSLTVHVSYNVSGKKVNIGTYNVSKNGSTTINVTNASGHTFYLDYATANGSVGGKVNVRASDVPL